MKVLLAIISILSLLTGCSSTPNQENTEDTNNVEKEIGIETESEHEEFEEDERFVEEQVGNIVTEEMLEEWHVEALDLLRDYDYMAVKLLLYDYDDKVSKNSDSHLQ